MRRRQQDADDEDQRRWAHGQRATATNSLHWSQLQPDGNAYYGGDNGKCRKAPRRGPEKKKLWTKIEIRIVRWYFHRHRREPICMREKNPPQNMQLKFTIMH